MTNLQRDLGFKAGIQAAAKAICSKCSKGMPVTFGTPWTGEEPTWHHIFRPEEEWWKLCGISEWMMRNKEPGHELWDRCKATDIYALLPSPATSKQELFG
jgi:hypothetical protein